MFEKENIDLLENNLNLIGQVGDIYHLLGALTYAYKISEKEDITGVIFVGKNWLRNDPIKEQIIEFNNVKIQIIKRYKKFYISPGVYLKIAKNFIFRKQNKVLHLVNVRNTSLNLILFALSRFNSLLKSVIIEEGIATYYNEMGFLFALKGKIKKILIKLLFIKYEDFTFFTKTGKYELSENREVTKYYREFISGYSNLIYDSIDTTIKSHDDKKKGRTAIIASYPILNHHKEYMEFIGRFISFLKTENIKVYIKPHQCDIIDQYNVYDVDILPHDLPLESLIEYFKPDFLFGLLSTVLVNANLLYKTSSVDLSNILLNEYNVSLTPHKDYINKLFGKYVSVLNTFEELKTFVDKESL